MKARLRRLLPPHGVAYELFDCATLLLVLGFIGYVLTDPPSNTDKALQAPFLFLDQQVWGCLLTFAGIIGVVCSYRERWILLGCRVVIGACMFWAASFVYGMLLGEGSIRSVSSAFIYAWIARRLMREGDW